MRKKNVNNMSTSKRIRSGELKINKSSLLSSKWQPKYCVLLRCLDRNASTLEIADSAADHQADKKKEIMLEGDVSIDTVHKFKEHPHAFEVHSKKEKHVFAVDDEEQLKIWVDSFREACGLQKPAPEIFGIEENTLYESSDQTATFVVDLIEAQLTNDLGLKGQYNFVIGLSDVSLFDLNKRMEVCRLPLSKIRRYGVLENGVLYVATGRRCPTGEGSMKFSTQSANNIAQLMKTRTAQLDSSALTDSSKNLNVTPDARLSSSSIKGGSLEKVTPAKDQAHIDIKNSLEKKLSADLKKKEDKKKKSTSKDPKSSKEEPSKNSKDKKKDKKSHDKSKQKVLPDVIKPSDISHAPPRGSLRVEHAYEEVNVEDENSPQTAPVVSATYSQAYNTKPDLANRQKSQPADVNSRLKSKPHKDTYTEVDIPVPAPKPVTNPEQIYDEPDNLTSDRGKLPVHLPKPKPVQPQNPHSRARQEAVYDEPDDYIGPPKGASKAETTEILYDQIDSDFTSKTASSEKPEQEGIVYSQPQKVKNAWRDKASSGEVHEEHYEAIKAAAESGNTKPVVRSEDTTDDDIYDQLAFKTRGTKLKVTHTISPEDDTYAHVVGGDQQNGIQYANYDSVTVRAGSCSQDEVQRSSAGSNSSGGYTEVVK